MVPLIKQQAQSLGALAIDTSLSRTFKIKKTGKKPRAPRFKFPENYFTDKRYKFRDYRIKKGRKIPLKNKWIEKNPFLLDTRQEVRKITLAKRIAQMKKGARKTKKNNPNNNYRKGGLGKMNDNLLNNDLFAARGTARKGSAKKSVRMLQAQQLALVKPARGGRKKHRKKIQSQYKKKKERIKLYKRRKTQRKALKKGKLRKSKPRRKQIINRINDLLRL